MGDREQIVRLAKGNPGALRVMLKLLDWPGGQTVVDAMERLGIAGPDVWVGYKDHCRMNLDTFAAAVLASDEAMLATIRREREP